MELKRALKQAEKYGRMIDPRDVIEGNEHLCRIQCQGCGKIPMKLKIKECSKCHSIICDNCYAIGMTTLEDKFFHKWHEQRDDSFFTSIQASPDCPVCKKTLNREKCDTKKIKKVVQKLRFKHICYEANIGIKRSH